MKFQIVEDSKGDKELYINDQFVASWDVKVDDMSVIMPKALGEAFRQGQIFKQTEIRKVLGL